MRRILSALVVLALAGCGGSGPKLKNLRCRADPCQHAEDPFRLQLAVDFDDPTGTLSAGALDLRVNGSTQNAVALRDVFNAQQLALDARSGTLQIDDDVLLSQVKNGASFTVSFLATNGAGQDSNEPTLTFQVHLGSAP
jgi:hypothetical protein